MFGKQVQSEDRSQVSQSIDAIEIIKDASNSLADPSCDLEMTITFRGF